MPRRLALTEWTGLPLTGRIFPALTGGSRRQ